MVILYQATVSLERKQEKQYAGPKYQHYCSTVPVFFPLSQYLPFGNNGATVTDRLR
jgi:hypothetical protein